MLYIVHHEEDLEQVKEEILPLLQEIDNQLLTYPDISSEAAEDDIHITYLSDKHLKEFLPKATQQKLRVGVLPHPENTYTVKGLGINTVLKTVVKEILDVDIINQLDLLYCNDVPVFQSVNIGNVFIFTEDHSKNNFFGEVFSFLKNIRRLPSLSHNSYEISSEGQKLIRTSALGIIIVEHGLSSVVSRRIISDNSLNDGMFTALVLSPTNVLQLLWFLFKSLFPVITNLDHTPSFIGELKKAELVIKNSSDIDFTLDGEKKEAKEIYLRVEQETLSLVQASKYSTDKNDATFKKINKITSLPTGEKREELTKRKLPILPRATSEEFQDLFKTLRTNSKISSVFIVMMILSTLIATFGLFANSSPVIIGAMILAPIISPIISFAMGIVRYDVNMLKQGIITILIGTCVALAFSAGVSLLVPLEVITPEIEARLSPTLLDMGIAIASGIAAAYAHAKEEIAKSLAGVAIAVALVPPLAVSGIGIGWWDWEVFSGAFLLYLTNLAGIIMFAGIVFLILGFAPFKKARMGLVYTLVFIGIVTVPLSLSFNRIKKESQITNQLEGSSINNIMLRNVEVRFGNPLRVSLTLVSTKNLNSDQVKQIKKKVEKKIGEKIFMEVITARNFK